ncbi:acyl--CoA ligase [Stieleria sp. JC731]|uniref:class I adenylate-forming enzyme family protein n=1 Tax=Pirellulaceae TaxID=2691357 RepID=UPI001E3DE17E|nr:class I adenylate-forming enzyme family protein [Stieleria sp. JC731]MCC9603328.1 acyl--CoA ligase [Stieleria sp. JC731]
MSDPQTDSKKAKRLDEVLRFNAFRYADGLAIWTDRREFSDRSDGISWRRLEQLVNSVAWSLKQLPDSTSAFGTNARFVHSVTNSIDDLLVALACPRAGLVEIPIDSAAGPNYVQRCRDKAKGYWLGEDAKDELISRSVARLNETTRVDTALIPTDTALVLWTSGTSGEPKGVMLSHQALLENAKAKLQAAHQSQTDRRLTVLSISHAYARTCDIGTWLLSGCTLAINRGYEGWCEFAPAFNPTLANVVPSLSERLLQQPEGCRSLQMLGCGGAAMDNEQFANWSEQGVCVIQGYGLTESGPVISSQTRQDSIAGHAGRVVQTWEHRIDAQDRLWVRGPCMMNGYLDDSQLTERRIGPDGWLDTGDVVKQSNETGQLRILGRADDRITLSNGHSVDPMSIERSVNEFSEIRTCILSLDRSGRKLTLWVELWTTGVGAFGGAPNGELERSLADKIAKRLQHLPRWELPNSIRWFGLSEQERGELIGVKGNPRRHQLLSLLVSQEESLGTTSLPTERS